MPNGAGSGQPDVYSNDSPGASVGCLPTTPGPRTSSTLPLPSVTTQCRVSSWTVSLLSLLIVTVYRKNHLLPDGCDRSGEYLASTCIRTPRVVASEVNILKHDERFAH